MQIPINSNQHRTARFVVYENYSRVITKLEHGCVQLGDSILVPASGHQRGECIEAKNHRYSNICLGRRSIGPAADW